MNKNNKFKSTILPMLFGALLGLFIVFLAIKFDYELTFSNLIIFIFILILFFELSVILHELGHLIMGLLTGYQLVSLRWRSFAVVRNREGKFEFKRFNVAGTLGQCIMTPKDTNNAPLFWYNFGGVLMNIICALLGLVIIVFKQNAFTFLWIVVNAMQAILNWMPLKKVTNDGNNYRSVKGNKELESYFLIQLIVENELLNGTSFKDIPKEYFESKNENLEQIFYILRRFNLYYYELYQQNYEAAYHHITTVYDYRNYASDPFLLMIEAEKYFMELVLNFETSNEYYPPKFKITERIFLKELFVDRIKLVEALQKKQDDQKIKDSFEAKYKKAIYPGLAKDEKELLQVITEMLDNRIELSEN